MSKNVVGTAGLVRDACAHGRALVEQRHEMGEGEAIDAAVALALRGAFFYFDVLFSLLPPDPPKPRRHIVRV